MVAAESIIIGMIPLGIAFFLLMFAIIPMTGTGWLYGVTDLTVNHCEMVPACYNGTVRFQVAVTPFVASLVSNGGSLEVQRVTWSALNSHDLCSNPALRLNSQYAVPNNLCNADGQFVFPSVIQTVQALTILAVVLCAVSVVLAIVAFKVETGPVVWTYFTLTTAAFIFAVVAICVWNTSSIATNYLNRSTTTFPVWNATIVYLGQVLIKGKYSSHYEDSYGMQWSDTLVGTPNALGVGTSSGYNLWIAGLVFLAITQVMTILGCVANCMEWRKSRGDSGGFGSGAYIPVPTTPTAGSYPGARPDFHELPPPAYHPEDPEIARPLQPAPPPPPDADLYSLKKEW